MARYSFRGLWRAIIHIYRGKVVKNVMAAKPDCNCRMCALSFRGVSDYAYQNVIDRLFECLTLPLVILGDNVK